MEEESLYGRLIQYESWLQKEKWLKSESMQSKKDFILKQPDCNIEYADPYHLMFANRQKEEKRNVKKARGKVVKSWIWTIIFGALLIACIVSFIIDSESLLIIGAPLGFFGALISVCGIFSKQENYKYLSETYAENVENMEKARLWALCEEKYNSLYLEAKKKAEEELEKFYHETEIDEYMVEQIPENMRNIEGVRKIMREVVSDAAYTIDTAISNIKIKERKEAEIYRICGSCMHYSKCKKVGTENCTAYFPL